MEIGPQTIVPVSHARIAPTGAPLELLRQSDFCRGLTDDDLRTFAELMRPVHYEPGQFVFKQGTPPDGLYVLESGEALLWTRIGDQRKELIRFQPGNTLCHSVLFEKSGRLASCEATRPSRVWVLDTEAFLGLRARRHEAIFNLISASASHLGMGFTQMIGWARDTLKLGAVPGGPPAEAFALQPVAEAHHPLLRVVPWVKALTADSLGRLTAAAKWGEVKRGHRLATEGGPAVHLLMVVRGALEVSSNTTQGKVRYGLRGPGRWAGHETFFSGGPQFADVVAKENTQLITFDRVSVDALLASRHELALDLFEQLTAAMAQQFDGDSRALYQLLQQNGFHASVSRTELEPRPR